MPNNKKDITGNVAPATGIPNKLSNSFNNLFSFFTYLS